MSTLESTQSTPSLNGVGASVIATLATKLQGKLVQKLDADGDGRVNQSEFQAALDKLSEKLGMPVAEDAPALFASVDGDGDGFLDGSELGQLIAGFLQTPGTEGKVAHPGARSASASSTEDALFGRLDRDGNGQLSRAEFMDGVNQARNRMDMGDGMVVHQFSSFSTFSMGGMGGASGMGGMPTTWAAANPGFPISPYPAAWATGYGTPPAATSGTNVSAPPAVASAPAATGAGAPADALNTLLAAADTDQDGQINTTELAALVTQLGAQLEAATQLIDRLKPMGDNIDSAQA